ncbi:hypothetical protein PG985_012447 [Apiospora marii]|uniref:Uncharacterized protein n=1 Tax=Apiospora marii TaxID=335849 RepID=A0ABR1RDA4_9PEZI
MDLSNTSLPLYVIDVARMTAETMGKVPALCAPEGQFLTNYTGCVACGEEQLHNGSPDSGSGWSGWSPWGPPSTGGAAAVNTTSPAYLNPVFGQYLGYCNVSDVQVVYTVTAASSSSSTEGSGAATSSIAPTVVTTDIVLAHDFTAASSQAGPAATVTAAPGPSPTSSTPAPGAAVSGGDREWIAGPIVGAVLGTALIALSIVFIMYYRRRKKRRMTGDPEGPSTPDAGPEVQTQEYQQSLGQKHEMAAQQLEKTQLHSDSMTPRAAPHELEGEGNISPEPYTERTYAELPGHENYQRHAERMEDPHSRSPHELAGGDRERMGVIGNRSELV